MCIYYTDQPNLNYKKQEHIISAAIGGKAMLPKGYVSDEFNSDISELEREVFRDSIISIARVIEGPGKRGKLGANHETKTKIMVIGHLDDKSKFSLGYLQKGIPKEIPTIVYNLTTGEEEIIIPASEELDALNQMKNIIQNVKNEQIKELIDKRLPEDKLLIGFRKGIESRYEIFYAKHEASKIKLTESNIKQLEDRLNIDDEEKTRSKSQTVISRKVNFKEDYYRIYAKFAFNYLTSIKGDNYVLHDRFALIRRWIAYGGENHYAQLNSNQTEILKNIGIPLPDSSHVVILAKYDKKLVSTIFLYQGFPVDVTLCEDYTESFKTEILICDWKNEIEVNIDEYIANLMNT